MNKKISALVTSIAMLASSAAFVPTVSAQAESPRSADLSTSSFFPGIINQGGVGSCVACTTAYYQFTYEARKALYHYDPRANTEFTYSPASLYPQINDGGNWGSWEYKAYRVLKNRGALTVEEMPYDGCFDMRFYKDENNIRTYYSDPTRINYITQDDYAYNNILLHSTAKDENGNRIINENDFEKVDVVGGKQRYRRKGEYITESEYNNLSASDQEYYVPVYGNNYTEVPTGLYWHVARTYRAIPRDEQALFNALKMRLDSYEGWSICSPNQDHASKALITEDTTVDWDTTDTKEIEDQFISNIKDALDHGKLVATSTSFHYLDFEGNTYLKNDKNEHIVFQNVTQYNRFGLLRSGHEFTIVGYDDTIECDINNDGDTDDPGEKGAFKIANSWGTDWGNDGFVWVMYDAVHEESALDDCPAPPETNDGSTYQRYPAFEEAYVINVSPQEIKLVSEVDVTSQDYYSLSVDNYSFHSQKITNDIISDYGSTPVVFSGPIYTDITRLCGSEINRKDYTVKLNSDSKYHTTKTIVKGIRLKDDKGNIVSECSFKNGDVYMKELTNNESLEYTLCVNFEKGDLNYDHEINADDYGKIMEYFDILNEDTNEDEKNIKIGEKFSSFQLELLDSNDDGIIDETDSNYFASMLNS